MNKLDKLSKDMSDKSLDKAESLINLMQEMYADLVDLNCILMTNIKAKYNSEEESNTPDQRSFEEIKMTTHIEEIFKNTQRIHEKSNTIDWIKVASIRSARFLTKKGYKPE